MGQLDGRVAFITGAARGQGRSHALCLAREGADIIAVDISEQVATVPYPTASAKDLQTLIEDVESLDRRIVAAEADVRDLAALQEVVGRGVAELGRLDIVIANAGISAPAPTLEMSEEAWQTMIDINLTGVWKTVRAAVPHVVAGGRGGSVVITSSVAAFTANQGLAHYSAAKAGLVGFAKVLAKELAPKNIRVNTIHPGTVLTPMVTNESTYRIFRPDLEHPTRGDFEAVAARMNALPTLGAEAEDISNAVLHLVSDSGRYITGTTQVIDAGGML